MVPGGVAADVGITGGDGTTVSPGELVLVTGASGYIGGRLVGELLDAGYRVRCLARTPAKLEAAPWRDRVEVVAGDIEGDLTAAVDGAAAVYYLVHSIGEGPDWVARERAGARNLAGHAASAGTRRIVYLGGLGGEEEPDTSSSGGPPSLSTHLRSRHEVGRALAAGPVPVTELRAAVIIGSGSASFEMLRYLVEVLPVMVTPKWVDTRCQPIAVRDMLRYLVEVLAVEETAGRVLEVGGPDVVTYRQMMAVYAEEAGLRRRRVIPVPVLSPRLSSLWVGLVTPLPRSLARPLVDSLVNEVVVHDPSICDLCPGPLLPYRTAVRFALGRVRAGKVTTSWADADLEDRDHAGPLPTDPDWAGGSVLGDERERPVDAPADVVYQTVCAIGGARGWHAGEWLWKLRGVLDKVIGGPGMRRGRRDPTELRVGDALDFWRVEALEPGRLVRLRAEMRVPGEASLEWRIEPAGSGDACTLHQHATFVPRGLLGRAYWYAIAPFHGFVFPGLLDGLAADSERRARAASPSPTTSPSPAHRPN
jgi:uncharacterized protein YbjT (DUF2867 family)